MNGSERISYEDSSVATGSVFKAQLLSFPPLLTCPPLGGGSWKGVS